MNTKELDTRQMVSVEWLLQNITGSVDFGKRFDFAAMLNSKLADYQVPALLEDILEHGFTNPIVIETDGESFIHGNGHHRLALAIALCLDEIPVVFTNDWEENHGSDDYDIWTVRSGDFEHRANIRKAWLPIFEQMFW